MSDNSFLGKGWSFPPRFDKIGKGIEVVTEEKDIDESLNVLITTMPGERIMNPEYGCNLKQYVYEERNESLYTRIKETIRDAIIRYEARIDVQSIHLEDNNDPHGVLYITIDYTVRQTNSRHNKVFPYYLLEGNNVNDI